MLARSRARAVVLAWVTCASVATTGAPRDAGADLLAPGQVSVRTTLDVDWGPLAGRLARPTTATPDDTWATLATREAGDARWAPTVRDLNGGGERPPASGATWVPPREVPFGGDVAWYSAYVDSAKFGLDSDVSRTGFVRLDPAARATAVFGTVTLALLRHAAPGDAARAAALPRQSPREELASRGEGALVRAAPFVVASSVPEASPVRRVAWTWRCTGVTGTTLDLVRVAETSYDAADRPLSAAEAAAGGLRPEWLAGVAAVVVLSLVMLALARRRRRPTPPA